jgi:hypothetical protein
VSVDAETQQTTTDSRLLSRLGSSDLIAMLAARVVPPAARNVMLRLRGV